MEDLFGNSPSSGFLIEHLGATPCTIDYISSFTVANKAFGLERYLKQEAFSDEASGDSRTYLVRDAENGELACYFSLRSGLITISAGGEAFDTIPAIELANFAVNHAYRTTHRTSLKIGAFAFEKFVLPIVRHVAKFIGIQCLYLYALPEPKLIEHYERLGFERMSEDEAKFIYSHIKPRYDKGCIFMFQYIAQ